MTWINGRGKSSRKEEAMIFDIAQLIVFLATVAAYGYYLYLIGKVKGLLQAVDKILKQRKETEND